MSLLEIHVFGAQVLRQDTRPVTEFTDDLRRLADDMVETMHAAKGIGLAAPQVGRLERLFVADVDGEKVAICNPEIVSAEGKTRGEEGCLSIPEIYGDVERAARVTMRGVGVDGEPVEVSGGDLFARCLQHELDHLHGRLFLDYLGAWKRRSAMAQWEREKVKYPALRRTLVAAADLARQHNDDAL